MEEKTLTLEQTEEIKKTVDRLKKENPKVKRVVPVAVFGNEGDYKELYVIYLKEPDFVTFSKFSTMGKKDEVAAMRQLAKECYLAGDKELADDDSLFLFGLMPQLINLFQARQIAVLNL